MNLRKYMGKNILLPILWLLEGIVVGFGAILPGISGGTLCVAFGMYRPVIEMLSQWKSGLKRHGFMLGVFFLGVAAGFVGLSGLAAWMLEKNTVIVTCIFIGFILGTVPELWEEAGKQGRSRGSYVAMVTCFGVMAAVLTMLKHGATVTIAPGYAGFLLCGLCWGLSFIVPGLSSSSLLLFFDLYQPMLQGIAALDLRVIVPIGLGLGVCVAALAKAVGRAYQKHYSVVSHGVLGIVAATAIMILPAWDGRAVSAVAGAAAIVGGGAISYGFTRWCSNLRARE